jgi:hypothetical protein
MSLSAVVTLEVGVRYAEDLYDEVHRVVVGIARRGIEAWETVSGKREF